MMKAYNNRIAVLLPCYNEGLTIKKVVHDFHAQLPDAAIYVYDNNSTDDTAEQAEKAGAIVIKEHEQGKGCVVRSMFRDIDADYYVMADGDDTYPAASVHLLLDTAIDKRADMVIGDRLSNGTYFKQNSRSLHGVGNNLVKKAVNNFFNVSLKDIMTGYRVFSRRFVKSYPALNNGFELETEMTLFALNYHLKIEEVAIDFTERPEGSFSKLNTFTDGWHVMMCIFNMYRHYKPLAFFSFIAALLTVLSLATGIPVISEFVKTAYVSKIPSAILASGIFITAILTFICGLILDSVQKSERVRNEQFIKTNF